MWGWPTCFVPDTWVSLFFNCGHKGERKRQAEFGMNVFQRLFLCCGQIRQFHKLQFYMGRNKLNLQSPFQWYLRLHFFLKINLIFSKSSVWSFSSELLTKWKIGHFSRLSYYSRQIQVCYCYWLPQFWSVQMTRIQENPDSCERKLYCFRTIFPLYEGYFPTLQRWKHKVEIMLRNVLPFLSQFCGQQLSPEFCTSSFP